MRAVGNLLSGARAVLLCLALPVAAAAHPVPFSYLDVHVNRDGLTATLVVHVFDAAHDLGIEPPDALLDPGFLKTHADTLAGTLIGRMTLSLDGHPLAVTVTNVAPLADRQSIQLTLATTADRASGSLAIEARLFPYDPQHQTFVNVYEGDRLTQAVLDTGHPRLTEYFVGSRQRAWAVLRRFVPLGATHIWTGPDHVLFLLALLLPGGRLRRLAIIVTAFTAAHSITLSLAALDVVHPSARVIEPAIALSIVYAGADNLIAAAGRDVRAWMAFGFGLIHGFGFASVLTEMHLPRYALGWALFAFNAGVEVGQVAVVLLLAFVLARVRASRPDAARPLMVAGSAAVVAAGVFWFVQRVWFPGGFA